MIAVTGASGHLGQWVVARLTALGFDVLAIARRPSAHPTIHGVTWARPVRTLACDLTRADSVAQLRPALHEVEAVVHLAAYIPADTARNAPEDEAATLGNVAGTIRLLSALKDAPRLGSFVYASTFEVYGMPRKLPIAEDHPTLPLSMYGASKLSGEKFVALFGADRGISSSSLRLPAIYGPGDTLRRAIGNFVRAAVAGKTLQLQGDGADRRELVYVADAAEAVALGIERHARGAFNIASGCGYSITEMAEAALKMAASGATLLRSERVKPRFDFILSSERARQELTWVPRTSLEDGVRAQSEWVRVSNAFSTEN